jgi:hypothetical protein
MSMASTDVTVEILKEIRDAIGGTNHRLDTVESTLNNRLAAVEANLVQVGAALLDLAEQQRFVVRYTKAISERGGGLETRVSDLETRVDKLESK